MIAAIRVFQFLIGTLKTVHEISNDDLRHAVSIPHRYAKNIGRVIGRYGLIKVSIPHRYAKNQMSGLHVPTATVFQFLIGTLKTD